MQIKDQIRSRREGLGLDMLQLAKRVGVTEQAVRHWESGRSYPGKRKMHDVEQALSFSLDWTEGVKPAGEGKTAAAMIDQGDVNLLLVICKLPLAAKELLGSLAQLHLEAVERARGVLPPPPPPAPPPSPAPARRTARKAVV